MSLFWPSCSLYVRPPAEPQLQRLAERRVNAYQWSDDLDFAGLDEAVAQSVRYFRTVSASERFLYGGDSYTPAELERSLNLFIEIIRDYDGEARLNRLRRSFVFLESRNKQGAAFFTGYYEPVLQGSLEPVDELTEPVYETPADLIEVDLGLFSSQWKNEKIVGRLDGGRLVPFDSREEIVYHRSLEKRARPIAYVNEIELFFLQIQGSGLISLPGGVVKRINYAQKNGHPYRAIGRLLKDRIAEDEMSMQAIKAYLEENPEEVRDILSYNQSYVFFREVQEGPLGDMEVPLTPLRSVAMDRRVIPRGALAFMETDFPVFEGGKLSGTERVKRFVLVQDTGGAIVDHGRVDVFLGRGEEAGMVAGHMKQQGRIFLLVARKELLLQTDDRYVR